MQQPPAKKQRSSTTSEQVPRLPHPPAYLSSFTCLRAICKQAAHILPLKGMISVVHHCCGPRGINRSKAPSVRVYVMIHFMAKLDTIRKSGGDETDPSDCLGRCRDHGAIKAAAGANA